MRYMVFGVTEDGIRYRCWVEAATAVEADEEFDRRYAAGNTKGMELFDQKTGRYISRLED